MAEPHDIELMQHADGELDLELASDDAREKVDAIGEMGEVIRADLELRADEVPQARFDAIWREVDKAVANAAPVPAEPARPDAPKGFWKRLSRWFDHHRGHLIVGAVSAGAVALLAIVINPSGGDRGFSSTNGPIEVRPAALRSAPVVESLETPSGTGNILEIDDEDGHTAVIWVTPQDIEKI